MIFKQLGHYLGRTYSKERGSKYLWLWKDINLVSSVQRFTTFDTFCSWTCSWCTAGWRGFEFCEEFHRCHRDERWDMKCEKAQWSYILIYLGKCNIVELLRVMRVKDDMGAVSLCVHKGADLLQYWNKSPDCKILQVSCTEYNIIFFLA